MVVQPVRERVLFYTYTILIAFAVNIINLTLNETKYKSEAEISYGLSLTALAVCCFLIISYVNNYTFTKAADEYVNYQLSNNQTQIVLYSPDKSGYFMRQSNSYFKYKYFVKEPGDVEFSETDLSDWLENYYKNGNYKE